MADGNAALQARVTAKVATHSAVARTRSSAATCVAASGGSAVIHVTASCDNVVARDCKSLQLQKLTVVRIHIITSSGGATIRVGANCGNAARQRWHLVLHCRATMAEIFYFLNFLLGNFKSL